MNRLKKAFYWLPAAAIMLAIFCFSAQPAEASGDLSTGAAGWMVSLVNKATGQGWSSTEQLELAEKIDYPVRKAAHLTEYALLGAALAFAVGMSFSWAADWKRLYVAAQLCGSLYAASDELHQLFVPGRGGRISDVLIDSAGVLIGCGMLVCVMVKTGKIGRTARNGDS